MRNDLMRIPVTSIKTAIFDCPKCKGRKISNVSSYLETNMPVILNVTCTCGNRYHSILDKRKQYRRETNLAGKYCVIHDGSILGEGLTTVCDISVTGMKLKMIETIDIVVGDIIRVEFRLDDLHRTLIRKNVSVMNINRPYIGTMFLPMENIGKDLGFYLFA